MQHYTGVLASLLLALQENMLIFVRICVCLVTHTWLGSLLNLINIIQNIENCEKKRKRKRNDC